MSAPRQRTRYPGIYKRGSRYSYTYTDPRGSQRYGSAATLAEARAAKSARSADVARGEFRELSKLAVSDYARSWIATYGGRTTRGINVDTLADYRKALGLDVEGDLTGTGFLAYAGKLRMTEVGPPHIKEYAASLLARGLKRNTVRLALAPVKAMFATAMEEGVIRSNPAAVRLQVGPNAETEGEEAAEEAKALTRPQLDALLDEIPDFWGLFFEILAEYGLRIGEAIELRWKDVDVPSVDGLIVDGVRIGGYLHVRRRFYRGRISSPKSGSARTLKMSVETARLLDQIRGEPDELVFQTERGSRISPPNLMSRVLKPAAVRAGIGESVQTPKGKRARTWVGFHTFRHTCATLKMREERWGLKDVQLFLGHASYATTERYYAHLEAQDAPAPAPIRARGGQRVASRPYETERDPAVPLRSKKEAHTAS
jgi:integrase